MVNKEQLINSMCLTYCHDYNLLSKHEQECIHNTMTQIFDNDIAPIIADMQEEITELRLYLNKCKEKQNGLS